VHLLNHPNSVSFIINPERTTNYPSRPANGLFGPFSIWAAMSARGNAGNLATI
jgi:hypothetical protein